MNERIPIVIDTREQMAYSFDPSRFEAVRRALPAGDYSLVGAEGRVAIERKSLPDFVQTVIRSRRRFHEELRKLTTYDYACIVVEGSVRDILERRYPGGAHPNAVFGAAMSLCVDWRLPVHFCGDRQAACRCVEGMLEHCYTKIHTTQPSK